jgi:DNA-binding CsgD family transcriptional regulator
MEFSGGLMSGVHLLAKLLFRHEIVFFAELDFEEAVKPKISYAFKSGQMPGEDRVEELVTQISGFPAGEESEHPRGTGVRSAGRRKTEKSLFYQKLSKLNLVDGICIPLSPKPAVVLCGAQRTLRPRHRRRLACLIHMYDARRRRRLERQSRSLMRPLSEKQVRVARMASKGMPYAKIADRLDISEVTVRFHLSKARERFDLASNIQFLVAFNQHFI